MNETGPAITAQVSCAPELADAMLKRVFRAAEILAIAKHPVTFSPEAAKNRTKNRLQHELRYRKD